MQDGSQDEAIGDQTDHVADGAAVGDVRKQSLQQPVARLDPEGKSEEEE